jgi:hypothetical protein
VFKSTGDLWNYSKYERQAQVVGVVALIPDCALTGKSVRELCTYFAISYDLARFRLLLGTQH